MNWKLCCPYNYPYVFQWWPRMLIFSPGRLLLGLVLPFFIDEPLQIPLLDKGFYLLGCIMTVIAVEAAVLISGPLARISLQLARECQAPLSLIYIRT